MFIFRFVFDRLFFATKSYKISKLRYLVIGVYFLFFVDHKYIFIDDNR
eukprot:UN26405